MTMLLNYLPQSQRLLSNHNTLPPSHHIHPLIKPKDRMSSKNATEENTADHGSKQVWVFYRPNLINVCKSKQAADPYS